MVIRAGRGGTFWQETVIEPGETRCQMANVRTGARLGTNGNLGVAFLFAVGARRGAGLAVVQRVLG